MWVVFEYTHTYRGSDSNSGYIHSWYYNWNYMMVVEMLNFDDCFWTSYLRKNCHFLSETLVVLFIMYRLIIQVILILQFQLIKLMVLYFQYLFLYLYLKVLDIGYFLCNLVVRWPFLFQIILSSFCPWLSFGRLVGVLLLYYWRSQIHLFHMLLQLL